MTPVTGRPKNAVKDALPRLRVQVANDLHLEFIKRRFPGERVIKPLPNADLLVLAGDITNGLGILVLSVIGGPYPLPDRKP